MLVYIQFTPYSRRDVKRRKEKESSSSSTDVARRKEKTSSNSSTDVTAGHIFLKTLTDFLVR